MPDTPLPKNEFFKSPESYFWMSPTFCLFAAMLIRAHKAHEMSSLMSKFFRKKEPCAQKQDPSTAAFNNRLCSLVSPPHCGRLIGITGGSEEAKVEVCVDPKDL